VGGKEEAEKRFVDDHDANFETGRIDSESLVEATYWVRACGGEAARE